MAIDEIGNLLIKGDSTCAFYWNRHELTKNTIEGHWIRTGDHYYQDRDGFYWFAGRSDDMLKVGGLWVSPAELEHTLLEHPAVLSCGVVGRPDHDGLIKPLAYVVPRTGRIRSMRQQRMIRLCARAGQPYSLRRLLLSNKLRLRWRKQRIPRHPDGWSRAEPECGEPRNVLRAEHRNLARGYARHRLHQFRRYDVVGTRGLFHSGSMHIRIAKCTKGATKRVRFGTETGQEQQLRDREQFSLSLRFVSRSDQANHRECLAKKAKTSAWCDPMTLP